MNSNEQFINNPNYSCDSNYVDQKSPIINCATNNNLNVQAASADIAPQNFNGSGFNAQDMTDLLNSEWFNVDSVLCPNSTMNNTDRLQVYSFSLISYTYTCVYFFDFTIFVSP